MGQETPEPPEPPLLELDACGLVVKFTPPSGATLATLLLHAEGGVVRYYSPKTKSFVAVGAGFRLYERVGQQRVVAEDGLVEGKVSATICYQSGSTMDLGPESARSNTLELARPTAAPCAPRVKPVLGHGRFMVSFALPALSFKASVKVEGGGNIYHVEPSLRQEVRLNRPGHPPIETVTIPAGAKVGSLVQGTLPDGSTQRMHVREPDGILAPGLSSPPNTFIGADRFGQGCFELTLPASDIDYRISVAAFNGVAWSDFGPATAVSDWLRYWNIIIPELLIAPSAPTLTEIGEDCVRVNFTSPPYFHESESMLKIRLVMRVVAGGPELSYSKSKGGLIIVTDYHENLSCQLDTTSCFVDGLAPNTEYEVKVLAVKNVDEYVIKIRDGPTSAPTRFKTLPSDVEITGVQTADERDEEAKKHAVDVDAADEPAAKRAKSES